MNKKLILTWAVVFVVWFLGSYLIHGVLLSHDYSLMTGMFRPMADQPRYFPVLLLGHIVFAGAFVWIYARGVESKPWLQQGVRFGIAIMLLAIVPTYVIYYAVQPTPQSVAVKQIIFDGILTIIVGIIAAWLYRSEPTRA